MRFCVLASGSSGNCIYVESEGTRLLIDCGLGRRELRRRLDAVGTSAERLDAVLLSHEHTDHSGGAGIASRSFSAPLHATWPTFAGIEKRLGALCGLVEFEAGNPFEVGSLRVEPFSLPHDAADTCGFIIDDGHSRLGVATDLGQATALAREKLHGCSALVIESNHDPHMLEAGPYPWPLKRRISGRLGHLSNGEGAALLSCLLHPGLRHVVLAHLSRTNNLPEMALAAARLTLSAAGVNGEVSLTLGRQDEPGAMLSL
jgi:phosphoribosyl 1,2-cyclic phosphodiesterase